MEFWCRGTASNRGTGAMGKGRKPISDRLLTLHIRAPVRGEGAASAAAHGGISESRGAAKDRAASIELDQCWDLPDSDGIVQTGGDLR